MKKLIISLAAILILSLSLFIIPSDAHSNYDGSPWGEGTFYYYHNSLGVKLCADDTLQDGHYVYASAIGPITVTTPYSSGAARCTQYFNQPGSYNIYICITGHWDCDYWTNVIIL